MLPPWCHHPEGTLSEFRDKCTLWEGKKKLNQVCCPLSPLPPRNGSVVVRGEVLFRGDAPAPTNSHLIRTVVTEASKGRSIFSWQLDPQSVQSGGKS